MVSELRSCDDGQAIRQKVLRVGYSEHQLTAIEQSIAAAFERSTAICVNEMHRIFDYYNRRSEARRLGNCGVGHYQSGNVAGQAEFSSPHSGFVWDEASGYYYDAYSGFYYDENAGLYYDGNSSSFLPIQNSEVLNGSSVRNGLDDEVGGAEFGNGGGEGIEEADVQKCRATSVVEAINTNPTAISPRLLTCPLMETDGQDDWGTPIIPIIPIEEVDAKMVEKLVNGNAVGGATENGYGVLEVVSTREVVEDLQNFEPASDDTIDVVRSKLLKPKTLVVGGVKDESSDAGAAAHLKNGTAAKVQTDGAVNIGDETAESETDANRLGISNGGTLQTNDARKNGLVDGISEKSRGVESDEPKAVSDLQDIREAEDDEMGTMEKHKVKLQEQKTKARESAYSLCCHMPEYDDPGGIAESTKALTELNVYTYTIVVDMLCREGKIEEDHVAPPKKKDESSKNYDSCSKDKTVLDGDVTGANLFPPAPSIQKSLVSIQKKDDSWTDEFDSVHEGKTDDNAATGESIPLLLTKKENGSNGELEPDHETNEELELDCETSSSDDDPQTPATSTEKTTGAKTLFIGNLSFSNWKEDVEHFFKSVGEVVNIRFGMNSDKTLKGYAHVEFAYAEAAEKVLHELNGKELLHRRVRLDFAKPRVSVPKGEDGCESGRGGDWQSSSGRSSWHESGLQNFSGRSDFQNFSGREGFSGSSNAWLGGGGSREFGVEHRHVKVVYVLAARALSLCLHLIILCGWKYFPFLALGMINMLELSISRFKKNYGVEEMTWKQLRMTFLMLKRSVKCAASAGVSS